MRTKLTMVFCIVMMWMTQESYAQVCANPPIKKDIKFKPYTQRTFDTENTVCIDVQFHIVRRSNGTGGFNAFQVGNIINELDQEFGPQGIFFSNVGTNFINSDAFFNIDNDNEANQLANANNVNGAINYYIVETLWNVNGGFVTGTALSIPSNNLVIRRDRALTATSPHEVGHCLNLLHTFQGTAANTSGCAEAINGSNCTTCGDQVCDTPADANIGQALGFNPDINNIMSYYNVRTRFTDGQGTRMCQAINSMTLLDDLISNTCTAPTLVGDDCACSSPNTTFNLNNAPGGVLWTVSNNLQIVSSSNTQVTVRATSSGTRAAGWVQATFNGVQMRKDIWVGRPASPSSSITGLTNVNYGAMVRYSIRGTAQGATSYEWRAPYPFVVNPIVVVDPATWKILSGSTSRNMTALVGPNSGLIQVMGRNKCGLGGAKLKSVTVSTNGGGGGPIPIVSGDDDIPIYPVPASTNLTIDLRESDFDQSRTEVVVRDKFGIEVLRQHYQDASSINIQSLQDGLYVIQISDGSQKLSRKISIKH